jgi:hypothetical protein
MLQQLFEFCRPASRWERRTRRAGCRIEEDQAPVREELQMLDTPETGIRYLLGREFQRYVASQGDVVLARRPRDGKPRLSWEPFMDLDEVNPAR